MVVKFDLNFLFLFRGKYNIESNKNSKTIVLNDNIIHPNELTGIGM